MSDIKFSQLETITIAASNDSIPIIDASNPLMSENGSNAIISVNDLADSIFNNLGDGAISSSKIQNNPTFFGEVTLPDTTTIGTINGNEIGYLSGLRENIQYQFDNPVLIGNILLPDTTYITGISTSAVPIITGTGGKLQAGSFGNSSGTFCVGNDPRIDNMHAVISNTGATLSITNLDNNEYIRCSNASGTAITLNGSGAWSVGMTVTIRRTTSAGPLTLTASNATINDNNISNILAGKTFSLKCIDISSPSNKIFDFI